MLAPGEYLINPAPPKPTPTPLVGPNAEPIPVITPTAEATDERPSFLLILLRALGAIHS